MLLSAVLPGAPAIEFSSVSYDSRAVQPGAVFVAIPRVPLDKPAGNHRDGHDYVAGALAAGAVAAVVEHPVDAAIPQMRVPSSRLALAELAAAVCGHPAEALRLIGVTGTDGKTTTVRLVSQLLEASGRRTGFATTTDFKVAGRQWENLSRETTIEAPDLQQLLRDMVAGGCGWAVLEATSQGLEQERLHGCRFHVAAFTNVTSDHLDWHKTMENYRAAKRRLFANLRPDGVAVLNGDDPTSAFFAEVVPGRVMTFGLAGQGNVLAENVRYEENGIAFDLHFDGSARAVVLPLLGRF
ncbi:MAG: Mur ligase family protein, partial [Chloroflexota bacterium]